MRMRWLNSLRKCTVGIRTVRNRITKEWNYSYCKRSRQNQKKISKKITQPNQWPNQ
jgi:hypothetical protein